MKKRDLFWITIPVQGQGAASGDGHIAERVLRQHRVSYGKKRERGKERQREGLPVSLPIPIKPPGLNHRSSSLITLSNPDHLLKAPHRHTIVRLSFYPLNTSHTSPKPNPNHSKI
jgi:hypothetical protein